MIHGWLNIDKPLGMTSHDVVARVRRIFQQKKVGHGGTLDPLASGVLPIALGEATKTVDYIMDGLKTYEFTISWGTSTTTDDREGEVFEVSSLRPSRQEISKIIPQFMGQLTQMPPIYSALQVNGRRAYELARAGKTLEEIGLKSRQIEIQALEYLGGGLDAGDFRVTCGKGTYVRSLGRDIAEALGTKGHLSELRRTRVGTFKAEQSILLENLNELGHSLGQHDVILPVNTVLDDIPVVELKEDQVVGLRQGKTLMVNHPDETLVFCVTSHQTPVALGEIHQGILRSRRIFNID